MTAIFLEWLAHCNQRSARRLLGASAMREFLAAATIAVVFVGGAFLIPASYERPVSPSAPRSLDASVPAAVPSPPAKEDYTPAPAPTRPPVAAERDAPAPPAPDRQHAPAASQTTAQGDSVAARTPGNVQAGRQVYRKCQA